MSEQGCTRAWQAEAREDGRLSAQDAASFERHAQSCAVCRAELKALAELRELAQRMPVLASTQLEHRRLRQEVLRRAHEATLEAPRDGKRAWLAAGALAGAAVIAALVLWPRSAPDAAPRVASKAAPALAVEQAPAFQATASADAVWQTLERGHVLRLALAQGQLELDVQHLRADQRFIVQLPDGELEVKGTRFVVQVEAGRTTAVRVIEGRVALRLREQAESLLEAGDAFAAEDREEGGAAKAVPARVGPSAKSVQRAPREPASEDRAEVSTSRSTSTAVSVGTGVSASKRTSTNDAPAEAAPTAPEPEPEVEPASTFARAMTAFEAGDYGHADALFAQFEHEHPRDARIEDALFLRALARARRGDTEGARTLARAYLDRFPDGLRKPDAERLAR